MGGESLVEEFRRLCFWPNEKARAARELNDGGGGSESSARAAVGGCMEVVADFFTGNSSSSSGSCSRSWSTEDGRVDDELCRAEVLDDS